MQKIFIRNGNNESLIPYFKEHRARIVIAIGKYFKHAPIDIFLFQFNIITMNTCYAFGETPPRITTIYTHYYEAKKKIKLSTKIVRICFFIRLLL